MTTSQVRNLISLPSMNLLRLSGIPILQQLLLEEKLLRTSSDNWCIINDGTNDPTIVMGVSGNVCEILEAISFWVIGAQPLYVSIGVRLAYIRPRLMAGAFKALGKPAELLEIKPVLRDKIPVIRRFTGGGTVIVDHGTVFISFICNKDAVPGLQPYPQPIMAWTSLLYDEVFLGAGDYKLRENDYVFGNRKFGGNAQSITRNRWIHHTSFLWDYDDSSMTYLKNPKRAPQYRLSRNHSEFICRIKDILPRAVFIERTIKAAEQHFSLSSISMDSTVSSATASFAPTSRILTSQELEAAVLDEPEVLLSESL